MFLYSNVQYYFNNVSKSPEFLMKLNIFRCFYYWREYYWREIMPCVAIICIFYLLKYKKCNLLRKAVSLDSFQA